MPPEPRKEAAEILRKSPAQGRARTTVACIVEAASQILGTRGEAALTTTSVAERAGVSIGTLYQYFADRDALLKAAAERERQKHIARLRRLLAAPGAVQDPARDFVRALIRSTAGRRGARRQYTLVAMSVLSGDRDWRRGEFVDLVSAFWDARRPDASPVLHRARAFALTHALAGALAAAAVAEPSCLLDPEFEDALCDLCHAMRVAPPGSAGAGANPVAPTEPAERPGASRAR